MELNGYERDQVVSPWGWLGARCLSAQLPRSVSMLIKSFQVLYYVFLVVPSLDFMLEDKSSQKLMVPGVPFIENVDISLKKTGFCHFHNHFMWLP